MRASRALSGALSLALLSGCAGSVTGTQSVIIQGSDTEVQLVSSLVEAFSALRADADISVTGGGSATGIAALLNGEADIANSSRALNEKERDIAAEKGIDVVEFVLARDGLSVVVHPSNPVGSLTVDQIGAVFRGEITSWKDLGGADAPIVLYGRQSTSGTFGFFRDAVLKDDYAATLRQMEGSQAIVDAVTADENGIGYVGVGYVKDGAGAPRSDLKVLSVAASAGGEAASPLDSAAVLEGRYPISRPIYQYLPAAPAADSVIEAFLAFEASEEGKTIIEKMGFYEPTAADRAANASALGAL